MDFHRWSREFPQREARRRDSREIQFFLSFLYPNDRRPAEKALLPNIYIHSKLLTYSSCSLVRPPACNSMAKADDVTTPPSFSDASK